MRRLLPLALPACLAAAIVALLLLAPWLLGAARAADGVAPAGDHVGTGSTASRAAQASEPTPMPEHYGLVDTWDPNLPTGNTTLFHPTGIAVDRFGVVVVVEAGNHRVTRAAARGGGPGIVPDQPPQHFGRYGAQAGELSSPEDVAVSTAGDRIYVADTGNRRVQVFSPAGQVLGVWNDVGLPRGIAVGPALGADGSKVADGRVYVSDAAGRRVRVYAPDGTWQADWDAAGELITPMGLSVSPGGDLVLADHGAQRILWLDADASAGPSGGAVGSLNLDNSAGPGGAPSDVAVDANGDLFVSVTRGILRFRNTTPGTLGPVPPGSGVAANLGYAATWPALREELSPECKARGCSLAGPGCARKTIELVNHEGFRRLDLRPNVGLFLTFAPGTRWLDRVVVYPAFKNDKGISPPEYGEGWVWPRLCTDYTSAEFRHATDLERIDTGAEPYYAVGLDSAGWMRTWRASGAWYDGLHDMRAVHGQDISLDHAAIPTVSIITGNQVRLDTPACLLAGNRPDFCLQPRLNAQDIDQLIRRDRTNDCRQSLPIPWRGGEGPCIPDDTWWHTAVGGGNPLVLDTGNRRFLSRTRTGQLMAGPLLSPASEPFRSFIDLDVDAGGKTWVLSRDGAVRVFDDKGRERGDMNLVGPAAGKAEALSVDDDGTFFVLTGDGWVVKYIPEKSPPPTATATPIVTPGTPPRPTRTPSRPTALPLPTYAARAVPLAAWRVADWAGPGRYRDVSVARDGRVLVPDADQDRVLVFDVSAPEVTPAPTATPILGPCRFQPDKVAAPSRLRLGQTTDLRLTLGGDCGSRHAALDVVVVMDASCQMSGDRLKKAREGLVALVQAMTLPEDRLAIVTFVEGSGNARLLVPLTNDRNRLLAAAGTFDTDCHVLDECLALSGEKNYIRSYLYPYGCIAEGRISDGLRAGREALFGPRSRPGAGKAMVLVSPSRSDSFRALWTLSQDPDSFEPPFTPAEQARWNQDLPKGQVGPVSDRQHALWEAWQLREAGVRMLPTGVGMDSMGFGHPPDVGLLSVLAWPADGYRPAGTPAELVSVLAADGRELSARLLMEPLVITDRIPANMRLVAGSVQPPAEMLPEGGRPDAILRWTFDQVPLSGLPALGYRLEPLALGRWPTNVEAYGDYVDGLGHPGRSVFPVPYVEVEGLPTDEPTPQPPTAMATPTPSHTPTGQATPQASASPTASATPTRPPVTRGAPGPIYLPVVERYRCQVAPRPVDLVLVMDTSSSMSGTKLEAAQKAASAFVTLFDLRPGRDRAAVVGFNSTAELMQALTTSRSAIQINLAALITAPGTRIDLGLAMATAELTGPNGRPDADRVIVLLTDGLPQAGSEAATLAEGARARAAGIKVWAIGLGTDAAPATLAEITGSVAQVKVAPGPEDLEAVYRLVASGIVCR